MTTIFRALTTVAVLIACVAVAGPAVAQDDPDGPGITINTTASEETETYAQEIDTNLRLVKWSYDDDRRGFVLLFEADRSTTITITEAVQFEEGAGSGRIYQKRLPDGQTRVFVKVRRRAGQAAVTMTTPESIEQNRYAFVSTGKTYLSGEPVPYRLAIGLIAASGVGAVGMSYGLLKRRREREEKEVERVL